ncbi:MAG: RNA 2',3'-cyclic phosphodiesterase [Candidatus Margulisbacteria bacterium]|nr:RNA 2',3'-cyclic phosphodiesterase [Candidatus Margulisiibacteriota bacterium]
MRVFISIELNNTIKKKIGCLMDQLKKEPAPVKWVKVENLHITLKFLGWVDDQKIDSLVHIVADAVSGARRFKAKFENLEFFPNEKRPRGIWIGITEGTDQLNSLAGRLEEKLLNAGDKSETREFNPHITIGRVKENSGLEKLKQKITKLHALKFGKLLIEKISIMKSTLTPKGPVYERIKAIGLD